ncbi:hypothetical protein [Nocardia sp. NBC_00416]|uniref:hypothetical protein n=1 Tax=Nocardia sp. NBC_00416 TaxID=2975991 RepID=UPI002E1FB7EB
MTAVALPILAVLAGYLWISTQEAAETMNPTSATTTVLSIGLHPSALDYSRIPGLDEETLTARIAAGDRALHDAGFDVVSCLLPADPDAAETALRGCAADTPFAVVMIGAGIRASLEHTLLFERVVNVVNALSPGVKYCFNTSPEATIDAISRWVRPGAR